MERRKHTAYPRSDSCDHVAPPNRQTNPTNFSSSAQNIKHTRQKVQRVSALLDAHKARPLCRYPGRHHALASLPLPSSPFLPPLPLPPSFHPSLSAPSQRLLLRNVPCVWCDRSHVDLLVHCNHDVRARRLVCIKQEQPMSGPDGMAVLVSSIMSQECWQKGRFLTSL